MDKEPAVTARMNRRVSKRLTCSLVAGSQARRRDVSPCTARCMPLLPPPDLRAAPCAQQARYRRTVQRLS
jgi:hypothetical protein